MSSDDLATESTLSTKTLPVETVTLATISGTVEASIGGNETIIGSTITVDVYSTSVKSKKLWVVDIPPIISHTCDSDICSNIAGMRYYNLADTFKNWRVTSAIQRDRHLGVCPDAKEVIYS